MSFCRRFLAIAGLALIATLVAISASADPDPPFVDGGMTTFSGDWVVDPGDVLTYSNQTIVMDGNVTIEANGALVLLNSTLVMNCTFPGEFGMNVLHLGSWNVTQGSQIVPGGPGLGWYAIAESEAHLLISDSLIKGAGYASPLGILRAGVYSEANGTTVVNTEFLDCYAGIVLVDLASPRITGCRFISATYTGIWVEQNCTDVGLFNLTFTSCFRGVLVRDCHDCIVNNGTFIDGVRGIEVIDGEGKAVNCHFINQSFAGFISGSGAEGIMIVSGESRVVNTSFFLNGSVFVLDHGRLLISNSSLYVLNEGTSISNEINVGDDASLTISNGSLVSNGTTGNPFYFRVWNSGHMSLTYSTIEGVGTNATSSGLMLDSDMNEIRGSLIRNCSIGLNIEGRDTVVDDVTIENCSIGLIIRGQSQGTNISNLMVDHFSEYGLMANNTSFLTLYNIVTSGPIGRYAVYMRNVTNADLRTIEVLGTPSIALIIEDGIDISIDDLNATATDTVVVFKQTFGLLYNVVLTQGTIEGGNVSISMIGVDLVRLMNITAMNASVMGVEVQTSYSLNIIDTNIDCLNPLGISISGSQDVLLDRCNVNGSDTLVSLYSVEETNIIDCLLTSGTYALVIEDCTNVTVMTTSVFEATVAVDIINSMQVVLRDCSLSEVDTTAVQLRNGTRDCTLLNLMIISSPTAVWITGNQTHNNRIDHLFLGDCIVGVNLIDAGRSNVLANTVFIETPRAVVATSGSDLDIQDGSFYDCPMAIDGDAVSDVSWTCDGQSEFVNSTARFRGWFTVNSGGSLNISHGNLTFLGISSADSGISAFLQSTLRIVNGSRLLGGGSLAPYSVQSEGSLVVRNSIFLGGGVVGSNAALEAIGDSAAIGNVTFADCELALRLEGSLPVLRNCTFLDNRQSLLMNGTSRPELIDCDFTSSIALWEIKGTFSSSLVIRDCNFEGAGLVSMAMLLESKVGERPTLTLTNVTISNYTNWGLEDLHAGSMLMVDCTFLNANASTGALATNSVTMRRVQVTQGVMIIGPGGFIVSDCTFINGTFKVHDNSGGSRISDSTFDGCPDWDQACLDIDSSLMITIMDLDLSGSHVGLRVRGGSEVFVKGCTFAGVIGSALDVNGSIIHLEDCSVTDLKGTGIRAYHVGSRVEMRNCTIQAVPGRTGYDVDTRDGGDAWLLNTTLNRTSVVSTSGGRVEVLWYVTLELSLPWGGTLTTPEYLIITDATGEEVINTSLADQVMRLYEFTDEDGDRTWKTPHGILIDDTREGVHYQGDHFVNRSSHFVLDLIDVKAPVARAGIDQVVDENLVVTMDGSGSSDNDPRFHSNGLFRWSFDEHGVEVVLIGDDAKYVFSVPGKYWINLTVTDAAGNVATDTMIVIINDRTPPVIRFTGNATVDEDIIFFFDGTATTDNNPRFDTHVGTFLWTIEVGDQTLSWETSSFGHAFPDPGNYTGTLAVWDMAGNQAEETFWVLVLDTTPPVIEGVSDAVVFEPSDGLLDASACYDNIEITSYTWYVEFENESSNPVQLQGVSPSFMFDVLGAYTVSLVLTDAAGNERGIEISVVVDDVPVISVPDWGTAMVGELFTVDIDIQDLYSSGLTVKLTEGPEGARVEGNIHGRLVWTPQADLAGADVVIEVEVHDGYASSQDSIIIHVNLGRGADNQPPIILSDPPLGAKLATPYIYSIEAEDPDGDVLGYHLLDGPEGMTISQGGTIAWDPPFQEGTVLVDIQLAVTDGRDVTIQAWTIRWKEVPNISPSIHFTLDPLESMVLEEFLVDLSAYIQDPNAYTLDKDDPNHALQWTTSFDETMVGLVSQDGLLFRFKALDQAGDTFIRFTVMDPSGAQNSTTTDLEITKKASSGTDGSEGWMLWLMLIALAVIVAVAVTAVARRRGEVDTTTELDVDEGGDLGSLPSETTEDSENLSAALSGPEVTEVGAFVEVGKGTTSVGGPSRVSAVTAVPGGTRVVSGGGEGQGRTFVVEGVAVLGPKGTVTASTGKVVDVVGPYQDALDKVRSNMGEDGSAVLEIEGYRILIGIHGPIGLLCVLRGREDDAFRDTLYRRLGDLSLDGSTDVALGTIEDVLAAGGKTDRADVVQDAWTSHFEASISYRGSVLVLEMVLRNDTDHIMNNVRLRVDHDEDALTMDRIAPKLLVSHGRISLGNIPSRKESTLEISFIPELCISSNLNAMATYTDVEGRSVYVPARTIAVSVECPYVEAGKDVQEERLLAMSEEGLGSSGHRVFNYGLDVDHQDLFKIAMRRVVQLGPMKVLELDDTSLMRAEAWFLGAGEGGTPTILVRVSSHGADHLLEVFVTSDDGATATGLLTFLAGEILDAAATDMPGRRVEKVRDVATLEEISVWPSLLDYKVMED